MTTFALILALLVSGYEVTAHNMMNTGTDTSAVIQLLQRRFPSITPFVILNIAPTSSHDTFTYSVQNGMLTVTASNNIALASGIYQYLKAHQNVIFTWGEDDTGVSNASIVVPFKTNLPNVTKQTPYTYRYAWNVCTYGYTGTWWDWPRWQWELDWMAFHGINLPLAFVGQEYVWAQVWTTLGATEDDLQQWLSGPAFLPWQRMGNMAQWLGPLSATYRKSQYNMQMKILTQMRLFGMTPVLPCFGGHVPGVISKIFPNASVTESTAWNGFPATYLLEPTDPLFAYIGKLFLQTQASIYGGIITHYYNCDTYNEMDPKSDNSDYLKAAGQAVVKGIQAADPSGVWVMQGWLFHSGYWYSSRVLAYLSGITANEILILDLNSEMGALANNLEQYFGKPWVWNLLHNYGGQRGVYGDMNRVANGPLQDLTQSGSTMVGIGITPEAIEQNPALYELMLDMTWTSQPIQVSQWVINYATSRYGVLNANAVQAWSTLYTAVYSDWTFPYTQMHQRPDACGFGTKGGNGAQLVAAWGSLLAAAKDTNSPLKGPFEYDLVDVNRVALSNYFLDLQRFLCNEFNQVQYGTTDPGTGKRWAKMASIFEALLLDIDTLTGTNKNYLLGRWIRRAHAAATTSSEVPLFFQNAINQITLWGPVGQIDDYASKAWQGMYSGYYVKRWHLYFTMVQQTIQSGGIWDQYAFQSQELLIGQGFYQNTSATFPTEGSGSTVQVSQQMWNKYVVYQGNVTTNYAVYTNTDIQWNDLIQDSLFSTTPGQLMNLCDANVQCRCVNSNGWAKSVTGPTIVSQGTTLYCKTGSNPN